MSLSRENYSELIDLLVDGELDDIRRIQLIEMLDVSPGGWKQCALGFLENQELKNAFSAPWDEVESPEKSGALPNVVPTRFVGSRKPSVNEMRFSPRKRGFFWGALAGCLLIGVAVGFVIRHFPNSFPEQSLFVKSPLNREGLRNSPEEPAFVQNWEMPSLETRLGQTAPQYRPIRLQSEGRLSDHVSVPCYDNKTLDPKSLPELNDAASRNLTQQLRNAGHEVDVRRRHFIVPGKNGEHILVPVDDTFIKYSGSNVFE